MGRIATGKRKRAGEDDSKLQTRLSFAPPPPQRPLTNKQRKHPNKNKKTTETPLNAHKRTHVPDAHEGNTAPRYAPVARSGAAAADYEYIRHQRRVVLSEQQLREHPYRKHCHCDESYSPVAEQDDLWVFALEFGMRERPNIAPEMQIYGVCPDGTGVCVRAPDFDPYFYAGVPPSWIAHCNGDWDRLQSLCLRWLLHMRAFTHRLVQRDERLQKRFGRVLRDGHMVLLPTNEEVRRGVVLRYAKDAKGFRMDFREDPNAPKQVYTPMVRIRLASPKLVPFVRQLLWYPLGIDDTRCALCGCADESAMLRTPLCAAPCVGYTSNGGGGDTMCPMDVDKSECEIQQMLDTKYMKRERRTEWHTVLRHHGGCPARFHGQCMRMWARAMSLRKQLNMDMPFVARCPCCTSDVIEFQPAHFGEPPVEAVAVPENTTHRDAQTLMYDDDSAHVPQGSYDTAGDLDDYEEDVSDKYRDMTNDWQRRDKKRRKITVTERKRAPTSTSGSQEEDWRAQPHVRSWFQEFQDQELEVWCRQYEAEHGTVPTHPQWLPTPGPTDYDDERDVLAAAETGTLPPLPTMTAYDANVDFVVRYQIDAGVAPNNWYVLPRGSYTIVPHSTSSVLDEQQQQSTPRFSTCALEVCCAPMAPKRLDSLYARTAPQDPGGDTAEWKRARDLYMLPSPPVRVVTWDGEMRPIRGAFPQPHSSEVIQLGCRVESMGGGENTVEMVFFVLGDIERPPDTMKHYGCPSTVYTFDMEHEMLDAFFTFMQVVRPNFQVTWNGNSFDIPYVLTRARLLGLHSGRNFGCRTREGDLFWKNSSVRGRAITQVFAAGTIFIDGMYFAQLERAGMEEFFSLNTVAEVLLGRHKLDIAYERMDELQRTTAGRTCILDYLAGDVDVTWASCAAMNMLSNICTRSMLTYTSVQNLLQRGTQFLWMCLSRHTVNKAKVIKYGPLTQVVVYPCLRPPSMDPLMDGGALYEGAIVVEPTKGFHDVPVATLDFASLYPSIMMSHNLCYSTVIFPEFARLYHMQLLRDYWQRQRYLFADDAITPVDSSGNPFFVYDKVYRGNMPSTMLELKMERKRFKALLKIETDLYRECVHLGLKVAPDGRPLSILKRNIGWYSCMEQQIKLVMNSGYGFVGLSRVRGQLAMPMVAETVTLYGQHAIQTARLTVERMINEDHGYTFRMRVIYGDTDSVFIRPYGPGSEHITVQFMMQLGKYLARTVTTVFEGKLELEFEKVYYPLLLKGKKNYIGVKWEPDGSRKLDRKGVRSKRRDSNNMQRKVTRIIEREAIDRRRVPLCISKIRRLVRRVRRGLVPLHDMSFTGSFTKSLSQYNPQPNAAYVAAQKEMLRTGRVTQPGERLRYVFTYTPHLSKDKTFKNTQTAEMLQYAQQQQMRYDPADAVERVMKTALPLMELVCASHWDCSVGEARQRLEKQWKSGHAFREHRDSVAEEAKDNVLIKLQGIKLQERCAACKVTLPPPDTREGVRTPQAFHGSKAPQVPHPSRQTMSMVSMGGAKQTRLVFSGGMEHLLEHVRTRIPMIEYVPLPPQQGHNVQETLGLRQTRIGGDAAMSLLRQWCGGRSHVLYDDRYGERAAPQLCGDCVSREGPQFTPEDAAGEDNAHAAVAWDLVYKARQNMDYAQKKMLNAWNTCRTCTGASMRGSATVHDCSTASCGNHGNRVHYTAWFGTFAEEMTQVCNW